MNLSCKNNPILRSLTALLLCASLTVCLAACGVKQGKATRWFKTVVDEDGYPSSAEFYEAFDKELSVEGLPGITFTIRNTEEFGPRLFMIKDGKEEMLFSWSGAVENAYFCDINGDGSPELCTTRYLGSGIIDSRINVLDFTDGKEYELADRGNTDYELTEKDGKLLVIQRGAMSDRDKILNEGPLQLKDGELKIGK